MSNTLVGIVTFGNTNFTKLAVQSIRDTAKEHVDFFLVIGKPGDTETKDWIISQGDIAYIEHDTNWGFPYSLNDIYDYAWKQCNYDYLILAGNDVVAYPGCIDSLIDLANSSDYECISSLQYDAKNLLSDFPEVADKFSGDNLIFSDFSSRPWDKFSGYNEPTNISDMELHDIQNLCLYKKSVFDRVGYTDVAFFPAYFVDNDYARRLALSCTKYCTLSNSRFFHFWSRTIHQGSGGSNHQYFRSNELYYKTKWGGVFGEETKLPDIKISDRFFEQQIVNHWRNR